MRELNQLLLNFDIKRTFNDHDYYVSDSNYFAFSLIEKWPKWEKKILNISGEKFSGKTHLANIFKSKSSALYLIESEINNELFKKIKLYESIIIDGFSNSIDENLIKSVKIFDVYQGENIEAGKKSIAFNVTLEPKDKTLSEEDIEQVSKKIITSVQNTTGATLRS